MNLNDNFPDRKYTYAFHSPGIEPWVCGLLKNRSLTRVLDIGCGFGSWGFLLRTYVSPQTKIIGVDTSAEKLEKLKKLNIYDELISADVTTIKFNDEFDAILAIEVLHSLDNKESFLSNIEGNLGKRGIVIVCGPSNPDLLSALQKRKYAIYKYFLRGLKLTDTTTGKSKLMWPESKELRILFSLLDLVSRFSSARNPNYIIAFKESIIKPAQP